MQSARAAGRTWAAVAILFLTLLTVGCASSSSDGHQSSAKAAVPSGPAKITIGSPSRTRPIAPGFVGLSIEFRTLDGYAGTDPHALNPTFVALMRNLAPGQPGQLRIGGDTTDWTWWPIPHVKRPLGVRYTLTQRWLDVAHALTAALDARTIVGINLEVNSAKVAGAEGRAVVRGIGQQRIEGFEIGNEPELYGSFAWFQINHVKTFGRPHGYDFNGFLHDFGNIARALPKAPLAGHNTGSPLWMSYLDRFLRAEPGVRVATLHRYPLKHCTKNAHPTIDQLLSDASSRGLADSVARYANLAHSHGVPLRIDEINSVSCGGQPGVSDTFATALWSLDAMFQMARVGVDGVNMHSRPGVTNELFTFSNTNGKWRASVNPVYYGLMTFAQAAPAGSRLLRIGGAGGTGLQVWATSAPDHHVRVVLINKNRSRGRTATLRIPGASGAAMVARLQGPGLNAKHGVTFGGQSFGTSTESGVLTGKPSGESVVPAGGRYAVKVPAASAVLLTLSVP